MSPPESERPEHTETDWTDVTRPSERQGVLSSAYAATTVAMFALIVFVAFEAMAVTTVMPTVARDLGGLELFALAFAAPLASGVVGMVVAGMWSDRTGPGLPLLASLALFALGLLICGVAPSMWVLLIGRLVQGLGGGAITVGLYVLVGLLYPARLQPAIFASFAAAWVLPSLFGPGLAAFVSHHWGWRWVFLGVVGFVIGALALLLPVIRRLAPHTEPNLTPMARLAWALAGAVGILGLDLLSKAGRAGDLAAVGAFALTVIALSRLLPTGSLRARRGLPAVVASRGLISAVFFTSEAYLVYVLQEHWHLTPGHAGIALTGVGLSWAAASQAQSRLGARISNSRAMIIGSGVVLLGLVVVTATVVLFALGYRTSSALPIAAYIVAGAGMGFAYPRTSIAMLEESTDKDRGSNSAALTVADSLGAALAMSLAGVSYAVAASVEVDPFLTVFVLTCAGAVLSLVAAIRTHSHR